MHKKLYKLTQVSGFTRYSHSWQFFSCYHNICNALCFVCEYFSST